MKSSFAKIIDDPIGQLLVGFSLLSYFAFLKIGSPFFSYASFLLAALFVLRICMVGTGKARELSPKWKGILDSLDFVVFIATIVWMFTLMRGNLKGEMPVYVWILFGLLVVLAVFAILSLVRGRTERNN